MVRLPRDVRPNDLIRLPHKLGFETIRQTGSHVTMTHPGPPQCHIAVPDHGLVKIGTLHTILSITSDHLKIDIDDLIQQL